MANPDRIVAFENFEPFRRIVALEIVENFEPFRRKICVDLREGKHQKELGIIYSDSGEFYPPNLLETIEAKKKWGAEITDVFDAVLIGLARTPIHSLYPKPFKITKK